MAGKIEDVKDAYEVWEATRSESAAIDVSAKISEIIAGTAAGIAASILIEVFQKTGLDRIFDSIRKDQQYADYVKNQQGWKNIGEYAAGEATDGIIEWARAYCEETRILDPIFDEITAAVNNYWGAAVSYRPRRDPLALDLDGDGIETVGLGDGQPVLFDHDADGVATGTGWLGGDDAWLTIDRNGNGLIDSGRELFGVDTLISDGYGGQRTASNGFEALASLDSNGDQVFDSRDSAFQQVRLWRDVNGDGVSQASELSTLSEQGVLSISLQYTSENTNLGNGNMVTGTATVTRTDGSQTDAGSVDITGAASNLDLSENPFYRDFPDDVPISDSAAALPDMSGSGWVRDLREAMSLPDERAASLVAAVEAFAAGANRDAQRAQLDDVLIRWADGTGRLTDGSNVREMIGTVVAEDEHTLTLHWTIADPDQQTGGAYATADFGFAADKYYEWSYDGPPGYPPHKVLTPEALVILRRLEVLEVFNGSRFLDFTEVASKDPIGDGDGGGGGGGGTDPGLHFEIRIADEQVQLINDAYRELSESVYGALVVQTPRVRHHAADLTWRRQVWVI